MAYEAWLRELILAAQSALGHLGVDILRPQGDTRRYTMVARFDALEHLQDWLASETRQGLIAQIEPLLVHGDRVDIQTGLEFWSPRPGLGRNTRRAISNFSSRSQ
jgi:uncharacterized protein